MAALQVALRAVHLYHGGIDGVAGPGTRRAVRALQRSHHLAVDVKENGSLDRDSSADVIDLRDLAGPTKTARQAGGARR